MQEYAPESHILNFDCREKSYYDNNHWKHILSVFLCHFPDKFVFGDGLAPITIDVGEDSLKILCNVM